MAFNMQNHGKAKTVTFRCGSNVLNFVKAIAKERGKSFNSTLFDMVLYCCNDLGYGADDGQRQIQQDSEQEEVQEGVESNPSSLRRKIFNQTL